MDYIKMMNAVDRKTRQLKYQDDKSNANTDSSLVSTKRSLIYQELNSEMYKRTFLKPEELEAMSEGYIYLHDRGSRLDTFNCCLADIGSIMKGGFTLGPIEYTEPKTVRSAIAVMSDCMSVMCGNQYGGLSVMIDDILAPYAEKSYRMYMNMYKDMVEKCNGVYDESKADEWSIEEVRNDIAQGIQGMEHTFNSVSSSRGDFPFTTFAFGVNNTRFGKLVSNVVLDVRKKGQGRDGNKMPVMFPKLVFLYDENLHGEGKELEDLFMNAIDCSSKCMYPDYLSLTGEGYVPSMYKKYGHDGIVFPMG
jgi:ribonucleoside-triphosphate reductase